MATTPVFKVYSPGGGGGGGLGDVVGPASATDNDVVLFDGATGKLIKDSGVQISQLSVGVAISAGTQSAVTGSMVFSNSNGITFGMSGSSRITASHDGLTVQSVQPGIQSISAGTTRATTGEVVFSNSNGMSFGMNAGTVTGSFSAPPAETPFGVSAGTQSVSTGTLVFSNSNNVTFGMSGSSRVTASASFPSETPFAISAGTQSVSTGTMIFSDSNGISFGMSGSSRITASYTVPSVPAQTNQTLGLYAVSNTTLSTSGTVDARTISFHGAGIASVGVSNGSVVISVPAGGGAGDGGVFAGVSTGGNTAGSTGTVSTGNFVLVGSGAVSLSQSTGAAGSAATVTINVPAAHTLSGMDPYAYLEFISLATSQGTLSVTPMDFSNVQFDRIGFLFNNTNSSNSSGSHSLSFRAGIYTRNVSTLSLLASVSGSTAVTHSGTAGSYSLYSGMRLFTMGLTTTLTEGRYWLAFNSNTTSGGTNGSYSLFGASQLASNFLGHFGSSHNTTYQAYLGQGIYTASTTGIPASIAFSQIRGSDSQAFRPAYLKFISSTV